MKQHEYEEGIRQLVFDYLAAPAVILIGMALVGSILDSFLGNQGWFKYIFTGVGGGPSLIMYYAKKWKKFTSED